MKVAMSIMIIGHCGSLNVGGTGTLLS